MSERERETHTHTQRERERGEREEERKLDCMMQMLIILRSVFFFSPSSQVQLKRQF